MKKYIFALILALSFTTAGVFAQDAPVETLEEVTPEPTPVEPVTIELPAPITEEGGIEIVIQWFDALYMALLLIVGFLAPKIPFLNRLQHREYVLLSAAAVSGMVLWAVGLNVSAVTMIITFLVQTGVYQYVFKFAAGVKSPKMPAQIEAGK